MPNSETEAIIRSERDGLLAACDYIMLRDYPISEEAQARWQVYRQSLRDISEQPGFPYEVEWPTPPTDALVE